MQGITENKRAVLNIDFNCDLAQSWGVYKNNDEEKLLDYVSSVNISAGLHAGEPLSIRKALLKAKEKNLAIGAHIGFPDIQGFGNREMKLEDEELEAIIVYQLGAIKTFAKAYNLEIEHVRPHGAMYKKAIEDFDFSLKIAKAIKKVDKWLIYYGGVCENLDRVESEANIRVAREIVLNMPFDIDGKMILDKTEITNIDFCIQRLEKLLKNSDVKTIDGSYVNVKFDTIHFNSKSNISLELAKRANAIIKPHAVNYNNAIETGWI